MEDLEAKLTALEERLARIEATLNQIHSATLGQAMGLVEFMCVPWPAGSRPWPR